VYEDYIYARISEDELELEKGVNRQLRECRDFSRLHGPSRIAGEYFDNDISAHDGSHRPGYQALITAVSAPNPTGAQRRIIVRHTDRLWRNRVERAHGIELLGKLGVRILPVKGPELDLTSASGRMLAGILGEHDTAESEIKAERIRLAALERAEEGRANGMPLYGWRRVYEHDTRGRVISWRDVENPETAPIVREIVSRILAGESLRSITEDLNRRGVPAPGAGWRRAHRSYSQDAEGTRWSKTSVRKIAMRPANIGFRIYHRGRPDERLLPAAWPPIVDRDQHDRVVALLSKNKHPLLERPGARRHLLTWGIGECGVEGCGAYLRTAPKGYKVLRGPDGKPGVVRKILYQCDRGCVGRNQEYVDAYVEAYMIALLSREDVLDLLSGSNEEMTRYLKEAEAIRSRMATAAMQYAEGVIDAEQLRIINMKLRPELEHAERMAEKCRPTPHLDIALDSVGELAAEKWASRTVTQKRAIMQAFGVRVILLPVKRMGPGFDPDSVRIIPGRPSV